MVMDKLQAEVCTLYNQLKLSLPSNEIILDAALTATYHAGENKAMGVCVIDTEVQGDKVVAIVATRRGPQISLDCITLDKDRLKPPDPEVPSMIPPHDSQPLKELPGRKIV